MSKTVLITGASTGFGRDAAERLARRGHRVYATMRDIDGRNASHRAALQRLAREENLRLHVLELDVTSEESVQLAVAVALHEAGALDAVINNAGRLAMGLCEAFTPEQFEEIFDVNLLGMVRVNRAVLPGMRANRNGLIIHLSSGAGRVTLPGMGVYCASKYAVEALADALRYELLPFGVDSVLVEPGVYRTPLFNDIMDAADEQCVASYGAAAEFPERVRTVFETTIAASDAAGSEEVAEALVRLVEMDPASRPFRTIVSAPIEQLLSPYNAVADGLRPIVAHVFNCPELAGAPANVVEG
jgi:NAD(P)-dependent dehydrogenase (short-subunit alcohol dehydrogenase family)